MCVRSGNQALLLMASRRSISAHAAASCRSATFAHALHAVEGKCRLREHTRAARVWQAEREAAWREILTAFIVGLCINDCCNHFLYWGRSLIHLFLYQPWACVIRRSLSNTDTRILQSSILILTHAHWVGR